MRRLVPLGNASAPNAVNADAVAFYSALLDALLAAAVIPKPLVHEVELLVEDHDWRELVGFGAAEYLLQQTATQE